MSEGAEKLCQLFSSDSRECRACSPERDKPLCLRPYKKDEKTK